MPEFTSYPAGTPSWVDLASPDLAASTAFYGALFGWEADVQTDPAAGGYTMFTLRGKVVAGLGPLMGEGQPSAWSTYITVEDVDKTCEQAAAAGATVVMPGMDVLTAGRMAVLRDPVGAFVSLWQPGDRAGADLANEPGTFSWNELDTRDVGASRAFYSAVLGWEIGSAEQGALEYYDIKVGGRSVAGMMPMPPGVPDAVTAYWLTYFTVADTDATLARVRELGGQTLMEPMDVPAGRFAVVAGPHHETFGVIAG